MSRRASLPGASELFRLTSSPALDLPPAPARSTEEPRSAEKPESGAERRDSGRGEGKPDRSRGGEQLTLGDMAARRGSGRQKHDAKITVYVSGDELLAMEHARLTLRGSHELVVDRGRLVREAVAVLLADFDEHGEESVLVRRLRHGGVDADAATEAEG